MLKEVYSEPLN